MQWFCLRVALATQNGAKIHPFNRQTPVLFLDEDLAYFEKAYIRLLEINVPADILQ